MLLPLQMNLGVGPGDTTLFASLAASASLTAMLTTDITLAAQLSASGMLAASLVETAVEAPVDATWPAGLPKIALIPGFREGQPTNAGIRSSVDSGPDKQRNRYSTLNLPFTAVFEMTSAQLDLFWLFYRQTLGNGTLVFDGLPHLRTGEPVNHRFNVATPPEDTADGWDSYLLTVTLEIVP